ncbi:MAG: alpha-L-fucosidase, partial [Chloroflexi bacterium]|nr:alpha-L-fucosidase [Chloroflexota bacterium]
TGKDDLSTMTDAIPQPRSQRPGARTDPRLNWFRDAKFGLFIHWGLYALLAGTWQGQKVPGIGEWIMYRAQIPVREYEQLAKRFNPIKFDAAEWVRLAIEAGQRYMVITAKHHDGFCLFKSEVTPYNIVDATPFGRDPLQELAAECARQGLKLGFYYSQT